MNNAQVDGLMKDKAAPGALKKEQVTAWLDEVAASKKREKEWRKDAEKITALYEGGKRAESPFNILYSNTETLAPALYSATPRPAVGRRFKDKDPLGAAAALTLNRTLTFIMDPNNGDESEFDLLVEAAILQGLVPGRGAARWKYDADFVDRQPAPATDPKEMPNTPAEGSSLQISAPTTEVSNERVVGETVEYDRYAFGYARRWKQVPWLAYEHHLTEAELKLNFPDVGHLVKVAELECLDDDGKSQDQPDKRKVAVVQEIWDKTSKKVIFISNGFPDRELKIIDDPLEITGFFNMAEPLHFMEKVSSLVPQSLYNMYREQAEELNLITRRITVITDCLKVRGVYDGTLTEMDSVLKADDGTLIALANVLALGEGQDLRKYIFLMPLTELVSVLQQLYLNRTQIKTTIYEITGISDIIRGSSAASETATAQEIKNQWGTLRLKKMQKRVTRWCKENLRIAAEIAAKKFSQKTFQAMTQLPYVTAQEKQQAQLAMQQFQQQQSAMAMQAQPGQPPAPQQPPPQQLVDTLATPVWEEIVALMRDTVGREFRVDIETNSTIADDLAEDQKNIGELLNALSQFLNGVAPLIENGSMPFEVAKTMMLGIVRKMSMGPEVEDQLEKMTAPKPPEAEAPPPPPPVDPNIELKAAAEKATLELKIKQAQLDMQRSEQEAQQAAVEHQNKMQAEQQKAALADAKFQQQMALIKAKAAAVSAAPATPPGA